MIHAILHSNIDDVKMLLEGGADVNVKDKVSALCEM